jgi:hypothetical protein
VYDGPVGNDPHFIRELLSECFQHLDFTVINWLSATFNKFRHFPPVLNPLLKSHNMSASTYHKKHNEKGVDRDVQRRKVMEDLDIERTKTLID